MQEKNDFEFDDFDFDQGLELKESEEEKKVQPKPKAQEKPKVEEKKAEVFEEPKKVEGSEDDFFGDLGEVPGGQTVGMEEKISRFPVERIKFTSNYKSLISIVSPKKVAVKTHYLDGVGSFVCQGSECCEMLGMPKVRYIFPIIEYDTNREGKPVSKSVQHKVLSISEDQNQDLLAIHRKEGLTSVDILVICKDEQFQKTSYFVDGEARWKKDAKIRQSVYEFWKQNFKFIIAPIARQLTRKRLLEALGIGAKADQQGGVENFEDVFESDSSPM